MRDSTVNYELDSERAIGNEAEAMDTELAQAKGLSKRTEY